MLSCLHRFYSFPRRPPFFISFRRIFPEGVFGIIGTNLTPPRSALYLATLSVNKNTTTKFNCLEHININCSRVYKFLWHEFEHSNAIRMLWYMYKLRGQGSMAQGSCANDFDWLRI